MNYLKIAAIVLPAVACLSSIAQEPSMFDAPAVLRIGDQPLNEDGKIRYPSPAIFDVDNDGENELVIGSLDGVVRVCENESESSEPVWSAPQALIAKDNQPLVLNNW